MNESTRVLLALAAAIVIGVVIAAFGDARAIGAADSIAPIGALWVNAIRMTVIPLVFSLLITSVASVADMKSIGRLGRRTLLVFVLLLAGTAAVMMPLARVLFALLPPHGAQQLPAGAVEASNEIAATGGQAPTFSSWLTSLLPQNPIAAAASGAMMPLVLFTILLAIAIARSPETSRETLTSFFRAFSDAMLVLVRWVILVAPIGVFALVLPLAVHAGATLAGAIGFYIAAGAVCLFPPPPLGRRRRRPSAALPGRCPRRPDSDAPLRPRRTPAAAHCLQLQLVHRHAPRARRECREGARPAGGSDRLRPA